MDSFRGFIKKTWYLVPTLLLCLFFLKDSYEHSLHDFSNSYFAAQLLQEHPQPETILFDIEAFNRYIWDAGYEEEQVDFYLNSPFTATAFYPLTWVENPYTAKLVFNILGIVLFLFSLYLLANRLFPDQPWVLICIPVLFFVPIRNQILFGQSYFLVFALIVLGMYAVEKSRSKAGGFLLAFAASLKLFPVVFGAVLLSNTRFKALFYAIISGILVTGLSLLISGVPTWKAYFLDVLPTTIRNGTATDFRFTYQSMEVFLKSLFVRDSYYNPNAPWDLPQAYAWLKWLFQGLVVGVAVAGSIKKRNELWTVLAIWVIALFLLQGRTATYSQILWIIPVSVMLEKFPLHRWKILLALCLLVLANFPIYRLADMPIPVQFIRLWISLFLAAWFFYWVIGKWKPLWIVAGLLLALPLNRNVFSNRPQDTSTYVLETKQHFAIFDFFSEDGYLNYTAFGRNGLETVRTDVEVHSFNSEEVDIIDHQVHWKGNKVTEHLSLKKKPVLVNNCAIYYLTDHRSRRGAFTIKKIDVCKE